MRFIDSHCHIDGEQFDADRDEVVQRAKDAGVATMLNVGTGDPRTDDFLRAVAVAEKYENVFASVGVHPHDAKLYDKAAEDHLIDLARSEKVIAWGEIGLDFYYDHSPRDVQATVFRRQIKVARNLGLPIIIHSRDADEETVEILTEEFARLSDDSKVIDDSKSTSAATHAALTPLGGGKVENQSRGRSQRGVMHCFGGSARMAEKVLQLGFFISFAGNVTFKKAETLRESAKVVPLDRLLVETDCPFLAPVPMRGKRNEPAFVVHTAAFLAELYGIDVSALAEQTTINFKRLFAVEPSL